MAFWSNNNAVSPHRQRNFRIQAGDDVLFWAKSVTKPSYEVSVSEYQIVNQLHKYPGLLTWNDITIVVYDTGEIAKNLIKQLGPMGYITPDDYGGDDGIIKGMILGDLFIQQYGNDLSKPVEKWKLGNAFVRSVNFGQLSYESDDFVEIEIVVAYDWAKIDGVEYKVPSNAKPLRPGIGSSGGIGAGGVPGYAPNGAGNSGLGDGSSGSGSGRGSGNGNNAEPQSKKTNEKNKKDNAAKKGKRDPSSQPIS
jgi:hypothetical protein